MLLKHLEKKVKFDWFNINWNFCREEITRECCSDQKPTFVFHTFNSWPISGLSKHPKNTLLNKNCRGISVVGNFVWRQLRWFNQVVLRRKYSVQSCVKIFMKSFSHRLWTTPSFNQRWPNRLHNKMLKVHVVWAKSNHECCFLKMPWKNSQEIFNWNQV